MQLIETTESAVRSYSRSFPAIFTHAKDDLLTTHDGRDYIDFLAGAGTLNYGHNPAALKDRLISYLQADGLTHGLDLFTEAKGDFLDVFSRYVLAPRGLPYRVQFCSPSGTNAVEAAVKLARIVTGRHTVVAFSGGFHGVSLGSLAATSAAFYRQGVEAGLSGVTHVPFPDSPYGAFDSLDLLRRMVTDTSSGVGAPAAILLESVQGEGGVYVAPVEFLRGLRALCDEHGILLVLDEIQAGCGRTGAFFSFERAGIVPDLVTLSKAISGYGLPMALLLIKPGYDVWQPGQHNGTFRGHQLAFVTAAAAIREYWSDGVDGVFAGTVRRKAAMVRGILGDAGLHRLGVQVRGLGLIWGIDTSAAPGLSAGKISQRCFDRGLVVETCGRDGTVLKVLPPLTVSDDNLTRGLGILTDALTEKPDDAR
jgi:diaminobutyrate-2-oxoglutarate transaminase